jgi:hypothetical protein
MKGGALDDPQHELDWNKAVHIWTSRAIIKIPDGVEQHSQAPPEQEFEPAQE